MHQNAPLPDKKIKKKFGEGAPPPFQTAPPLGRGIPPPHTLPPRRLDSRAFGARRSSSFSFTTRTLVVLKDKLGWKNLWHDLGVIMITWHSSSILAISLRNAPVQLNTGLFYSFKTQQRLCQAMRSRLYYHIMFSLSRCPVECPVTTWHL